jgi:hypothetical protein
MPMGWGPLGTRGLGGSPNLGLLYQIRPEEEAAYFESLGRLVAAYAAAEASVHELVRKLSSLSEQKARIIFAGMRLGDLTERVRGIIRLYPDIIANSGSVEPCLVQLDLISGSRNKLVHRSINFFAGAFIVSNASTAKSLDVVQTETFTRTDMDNMAQDCRIIFLRIGELAGTLTFKLDDDLAGRPWRYKRVRPIPQKKSPRKAQKGPQHAPDA